MRDSPCSLDLSSVSMTVLCSCLFSFSSASRLFEGEFESFLFFVITSSVVPFEVEKSSVRGRLVGVVGALLVTVDRNMVEERVSRDGRDERKRRVE